MLPIDILELKWQMRADLLLNGFYKPKYILGYLYMNHIKEILIKISYAIGANALGLFVSILATLIIPRFLGNKVEQYGYFQLYVFYESYIGFFHFGWCDGILLRDGGKYYKDLDKGLYSAQFWLLSLFELIISIVIICFSIFFEPNKDFMFIYTMIGLSIFVWISGTMLTYYLQTTNRIKEYSLITTANKIVYGATIVLVFLIGKIDYRFFIYGCILGRIIALFMAVYFCKDIVFHKPSKFNIAIREAGRNISVGIKLMFANIAIVLMTGIVRLGIQKGWSVSVFGKVSLTLNVSNFFMIFISAVALVLYPTLRRVKKDDLPNLYFSLNDLLMIPIMGLMIFYFPIQLILHWWLPQYSDGLKYMAILFPICILTAKSTMLIQTYMQVYRYEKMILKVNVICVILALITTVISTQIIHDLTLAVMSMVFNQLVRCIYSEILLTKNINVDNFRNIILECILIIVFVLANWILGGIIGISIYTIVYFSYLIIKKNDINTVVLYLKSFYRNQL